MSNENILKHVNEISKCVSGILKSLNRKYIDEGIIEECALSAQCVITKLKKELKVQ